MNTWTGKKAEGVERRGQSWDSSEAQWWELGVNEGEAESHGDLLSHSGY